MTKRMRAFTPVQEAIGIVIEEWCDNYVRGGDELQDRIAIAKKHGWGPEEAWPEHRVSSQVHYHAENINIYWRCDDPKVEHKIWGLRLRGGCIISKERQDEVLAYVESKVDPIQHIYGMKLKGWWCVNAPEMESDLLQQLHKLAANSPHFKHLDPETYEFVLDVTPPDVAAEVEAAYQRRLQMVSRKEAP